MDPHSAIRARGLCQRFGARSALERVDLDIATGECVVLTGANGSGKTTLLRCLAGSLRPTAGEILIFGRPVSSPGARQAIGVAAHESRLYPQLTLRENLLFAARMYGVPRPVERADAWLERIGLEAHALRQPTQVSRGMRQRIALARALIHEPPLVLLDEPFSNLDAAGGAWLLDVLTSLHRAGRTLCLALHDQKQSRALADRILELRGGRAWEVFLGNAALRVAA